MIVDIYPIRISSLRWQFICEKKWYKLCATAYHSARRNISWSQPQRSETCA